MSLYYWVFRSGMTHHNTLGFTESTHGGQGEQKGSARSTEEKLTRHRHMGEGGPEGLKAKCHHMLFFCPVFSFPFLFFFLLSSLPPFLVYSYLLCQELTDHIRMGTKSKGIKSKSKEVGLHPTKKLLLSKETVNRMKRQTTGWEKIALSPSLPLFLPCAFSFFLQTCQKEHKKKYFNQPLRIFLNTQKRAFSAL